jgi:hypothetical protein
MSSFLVLSSPRIENEILFKETNTTNDDGRTISLPDAPADLLVGSVVLLDSTQRTKYLDQSLPTEPPSRFSDHDAGSREDGDATGRSLPDNKAAMGRTDERKHTLGRRGVGSGGGVDGGGFFMLVLLHNCNENPTEAKLSHKSTSLNATHREPPKPLNYVLLDSDSFATKPAYVVCFMCSTVDIFT